MDDMLSDDSDLDEDERAALRMLSPDVRAMISELQQAGANKSFIKKKIRQTIQGQQTLLMYPEGMAGSKGFKANYEINFSDLQFDRKLSEGGYGIVYRGRWKHTTVAIKEIKREIIEQDKLEEFKNECAVMEVIRHPNVVLFLGACTKQPNLCIILEFCSKGSLWSLLHDMSIKMNWEYRKKFALDIAKGVYYLHTNK
jgi:mitogen-activated protein kinase kinase kinase 9